MRLDFWEMPEFWLKADLFTMRYLCAVYMIAEEGTHIMATGW